MVEAEFTADHRILGSKKITEILRGKGESVSRRLVARIMRERGFKSKVVKKYKATTNSNHNLPVADNLLNREFQADRLNEKWVSDITYVATNEGWLYVACIRRVVAEEIRGVWLIHSYSGSQYCSHEYQRLLKQYGFICSMSRKGDCWDNAPMESVWGKLKQE